MENGILSDHTRRVRKSLLISSVIGFSISKIGLTVNKVSLLGSEFSIINYKAIPFIISLIIVYFLITFISYALSEYASHHRKGVHDYIDQIASGSVRSRDALLHSISLLEREISTLKPTGMNSPLPDIKKEIEKKKFKLRNLRNILKYHETKRKSIFDYFTFNKLRLVIELILPIIVGIISLIILIFYTDIHSGSNKGISQVNDSATIVEKTKEVAKEKK